MWPAWLSVSKGDATKRTQKALYAHSVQALDAAKLQGNRVEFNN